MKIIIQNNNFFVLRFDKDEEVFSVLAGFLQEQNITACAFHGLGSSASVELGYYNGHIKDYRKKPFVEELEIISLIGNGGVKDGQPIIHAHGMFGRTDFTVFGGHVFNLTVSATCEIFLTKMEGILERKLDGSFNLNLIS